MSVPLESAEMRRDGGDGGKENILFAWFMRSVEGGGRTMGRYWSDNINFVGVNKMKLLRDFFLIAH